MKLDNWSRLLTSYNQVKVVLAILTEDHPRIIHEILIKSDNWLMRRIVLKDFT